MVFAIFLMSAAVVTAIVGSIVIWGYDMRRANGELASPERFRAAPAGPRELESHG